MDIAGKYGFACSQSWLSHLHIQNFAFRGIIASSAQTQLDDRYLTRKLAIRTLNLKSRRIQLVLSNISTQ